jgi:signal peptidase I
MSTLGTVCLQWWNRRTASKQAHELLRHARHIRAMRSDVAAPEDLRLLSQAIAQLATLDDSATTSDFTTAEEKVMSALKAVNPPRFAPGWRENLEVLTVAVAVAMAFRTYFIQPFKIPTGSMQPTLYGIHYLKQDDAQWSDRWPFKIVQWMVRGSWFQEFPARATGVLQGPYSEPDNAGSWIFTVGGVIHRIPRDLPLRGIRPGDTVFQGQTLACGKRYIGDHIFVDKVRWNFTQPKRGDVSVFKTDNIDPIGRVKTHYIKRLIGLPDETVSIEPPRILIDGKQVEGNAGLDRNQMRLPGYAGYGLTGNPSDRLGLAEQKLVLHQGEFLMMGDNTKNSFDGRYWGPVPQDNMMGPAVVVYWPFSSRWGRIR